MGWLTQRLVRLVDRKGRVSLPETGPVLVSGKSLGEVQKTSSARCGVAYRDVSADVRFRVCEPCAFTWWEMSRNQALMTSVRFRLR